MGHLGDWKITPPAPETCQECAVEHEPELPHDQTSLYYQYRFYDAHGHWPTWNDAMAHCSEKIKTAWSLALAQNGIDVTEITCPQCGRTSYHPEDIKNRYCGSCHQFHESMQKPPPKRGPDLH